MSKAKTDNRPNLGFEQKLWQTAETVLDQASMIAADWVDKITGLPYQKDKDMIIR